VKWWIGGGDFYQNTWSVVKSEIFGIYPTRTIDQAQHGSVSIAQSGPIFAAVVPEFPGGISILPEMYQHDVEFADIPCTNIPSEEAPSLKPTNSPRTQAQLIYCQEFIHLMLFVNLTISFILSFHLC
jgi:hypothetical protein